MNVGMMSVYVHLGCLVPDVIARRKEEKCRHRWREGVRHKYIYIYILHIISLLEKELVVSSG